MIKVSLLRNKKVRRLLICIIGIAVSILIYLFYSKINVYLDELSAKNLIQDFVDNSKRGNEKGIKDCFIKEYQRSLDAYKKYNPGKPLFDWRIVKLNRIKIAAKKYGESEVNSPDYSNIMNWKGAKVFYTEVVEKTTKDNFIHKNGLNYLIFITVKQQGRWKIVSISHDRMNDIIRNNVGFGVSGEKDVLKRDDELTKNLVLGPRKFDYRNMIIPEYDPDKSIIYNMSYDELEKRIKTVKFKLEGGTSCTITKKTNIINLIRDIDKIKSEMPLTKIGHGRGGYIDSVCSVKLKTKLFSIFNISKFGNTLIYYDPYYNIAKAIPNSMIKLLLRNGTQITCF